jgi:hypothetical protein
MLRLVLMIALLAIASPSLADSPAAISDAGRDRVEDAFDEFARQWMKKVHSLEAEHRKNPSVKQGSSSPVVTYRGYADDYSVELRPTGHPSAPYVGLLRYTEHVYSCTDMKAADCSIASTVPVTEIFRYQNGRWSY